MIHASGITPRQLDIWILNPEEEVWNDYMYIHAYVHICRHIYVCVCMHFHIFVYIYIHMCISKILNHIRLDKVN